MLARVFPLQQALGHPLVDFIEQQHKEWRHTGFKGPAFFNLDQPVSAETSSFSPDAKITDDEPVPLKQCARCTRIRKEVNSPKSLPAGQQLTKRIPCFVAVITAVLQCNH